MYVYVYFIELDFFSLNLFRCRHLETNLDGLFKSVRWSACKMASFSVKQRFQRLAQLGYRGGLARREFGSFPVGRSTVSRSSDSLGSLKTNFKKLTNNQEYEPVPYIMISQLFFSNNILYSLPYL